MKKTLVFLLVTTTTILQAQHPEAGKWKPWLISSVKEYRLPPPPSTKDEIAAVIQVQQQATAMDLQQVRFWNAGAPGYRWKEMMAKLWVTDTGYNGMLANLLLGVAIYDATIAAWDSKYSHNRQRPFQADKKITAHGLKPESPSYPCEHSVAAGIAATLFSHFFPRLADSVNRMAQQQMRSRVVAGMAYPSDTRAGFELGKRIAEKQIALTQGHVPQTAWDGKMPGDPHSWRGQKPMYPVAGKAKTFILDSGSQFRPGPPPDAAKEMEALRKHKQGFRSMANAFLYASQPVFEDLLNKKIFEYNLHLDPPMAAKIYAAVALGNYDGFVSCWDAKYAYWGTRPDLYDTTFKPVLFQSPPFPGYPSGHAMLSAVNAEVYSYFFPADADLFRKKAKECAESRFQGGIHFKADNDVALEMGEKVGKLLVQRLKKMEE